MATLTTTCKRHVVAAWRRVGGQHHYQAQGCFLLPILGREIINGGTILYPVLYAFWP